MSSDLDLVMMIKSFLAICTMNSNISDSLLAVGLSRVRTSKTLRNVVVGQGVLLRAAACTGSRLSKVGQQPRSAKQLFEGWRHGGQIGVDDTQQRHDRR